MPRPLKKLRRVDVDALVCVFVDELFGALVDEVVGTLADVLVGLLVEAFVAVLALASCVDPEGAIRSGMVLLRIHIKVVSHSDSHMRCVAIGLR